MSEQPLKTALGEVLEPELGQVDVVDLQRLTAGANRETWRFDAVDEAQTRHELILQRDREGLERLAGGCAGEAEVIRCAAAHGVPVAEVIVSAHPPNPLERSFTISRRIPGETIGRRILRDPQWSVARDRFVQDCAAALAAVHRMTPADLPDVELAHTPDALGALVDTYLALRDPHPAFDLAIRWLKLNRPASLGTCLVHGDFRLGNLILDPGGLAAALDWEIAHYGDPGEDLGWICVRAWRFGGPKPVGGMGTHEELLSAYRAAGGALVDLDTLQWWQLYGTLRWGVICMQLGADFSSGRTRSIEMAAIGRRVVESEYDVLRLLP